MATAVPAAAQPAQDPTKGPLPVPFDLRAGIAANVFPENPPPGANDWNCKPTAAHPRPVVLVNPTFTTQALAWQAGAPLLKNAGYCVFTFNYGNPKWLPTVPFQAVDDIRDGGRVLADVVDRVLAATGARQVDLVGHSQGGGIASDYYLKVLGGAPKVQAKIGISPSRGTNLSQIAYLRTIVPIIAPAVYGAIETSFPALIQQVFDNPLQLEVYGPGAETGRGATETVPGPKYTHISTKHDEVVTPFDEQFVYGPNTTNVFLQENCEVDKSEHVSTLYSERALRFVLNALDPAGAQPVACFPVQPYVPYVR